jgi:hypothetical protein
MNVLPRDNKLYKEPSEYPAGRAAMSTDGVFSNHATVPTDVLWNEVEGELILLNLATEKYFGLDTTGAAVWAAVIGSPTIEDACRELLATYDVEPERLRTDLQDLLREMTRHGLLELAPPEQ